MSLACSYKRSYRFSDLQWGVAWPLGCGVAHSGSGVDNSGVGWLIRGVAWLILVVTWHILGVA
jgi:hypothetical protein